MKNWWIPSLAIGDRIKHSKYGEGVIRKIDDSVYPNYAFFYYVDFSGKKGDGTKIWLPKHQTEKNCEKLN